MAKNTMGTKLPRKLEQKMQIVGEQIKLARLRRNLSVAQVAERATCSPLTVSRIEKGIPTVAIGIYLRVLYALQLDDDILLLAKEDKMGKALQDLSLKTRERATCSPLTVSRIEKGIPTVAIGIYLRVLYALQLDDDILLLAKEDKMGKALQDLSLKTRERASKKE